MRDRQHSESMFHRGSWRLLALLLLVLLAPLAAIGSRTGRAEALSNCDVSDLTVDSEEQAFLGLINTYRSQNSAGPLTMSANLNRAASWLVVDMGTNNYFSHTDSLGRAFNNRIIDCGGAAAGMAENIAAGYATAQAVFDAWRNSPGHNANMLNGSFKQIGIARYFGAGSNYGWFWATDFSSVDDGTTPGGSSGKASITSPTAGTVLSGSNVTFTRDAGTGVQAFALQVGTSLGSGDIFQLYSWPATSANVTGIPTNGSRIYARIWSFLNGSWQITDYAYTAATSSPASGKASLISPAPNSMLPASGVTFVRDNGIGAQAFGLQVGTSLGSGDLLQLNAWATTTAYLGNLPTNGGTVYARIWSYVSGTWFINDYTYQTAPAAPSGVKAAIVSPVQASALPGPWVTFTRDAGSGVQAVGLQVGTSAGSGDLLQLNSWTTTTAYVNVPTDGSVVYVRIWSFLGGAWQISDYTYQASKVASTGTKVAITSPVQGSTLPGTNVTFTRDAGAGVSAVGLQVGTSPGAGNLLQINSWTSTTATVSNIPANGSIVYVRVWSNLGGTWQITDYTYKAPG